MTTIFLVMGETSEWESQEKWPVQAFTDREDARALCGRLNTWCRDRGLDKKACYVRDDQGPPEDPGFECYTFGTRYYIYDVPFNEKAPVPEGTEAP